jgi:hypothetical protein
MPKAPVNEHGHTRRGEDEIGGETPVRQRAASHAVAETQTMNCFPNR